MTVIGAAELQQHVTRESCWVVVQGNVYDVTSFLDAHPGGASILLQNAGKDATKQFIPFHPSNTLDDYATSMLVGKMDPHAKLQEDLALVERGATVAVPPISEVLNVMDMEPIAQQTMVKQGWVYYSTGCEDHNTLQENRSAFSRWWFRPRVLVNVLHVDTSSSMLGHPCSFPVYISATALGRLAHPDGEVALARAAAAEGVIQMCPTLSSCSIEDIAKARAQNQTQFFQLYVSRDRTQCRDLILKAERLGMKALFVTVDAPQLGRRESDLRNKFTYASSSVQKDASIDRSKGVSTALTSFIDPSLDWDDIDWIQSLTSMPVVLKGIQCGEDAVKAHQRGIRAIVLSNHGGRQLEFARSAIDVLEEVMLSLDAIGARDSMEVYVDGGFRRGTDIAKALALGAKAVGVGRPALYGLAAYGQDGVEHVLRLLRSELELCMRLLGTPSIQSIRRSLVCRQGEPQYHKPSL